MTTLLPIALGLLLQSTALLLLGLLALRLARRRGPAVQSLIGRATLAGVGLALLLAAPLTGRVRPLWHVTLPVSPPAPNNGGVATPPPGAATLPRREGQELGPKHYGVAPAEMTEGKGAAQGKGAASSAPTPPLSTSSPSRLGRVAAPGGGGGSPLAALWGLGTALLLLWLGVCQRHLARLRREASSVTSGPAAEMLAALTPHPPALLAHPSVRSPFLAGLWHPGIFLPAAYATDFGPITLRAILAHELAHLARRDNAWTLAARLLCALLWPQPLLWVLCRRLEQISEEACDQAVLAHDCPPRAYADCLLTLAERHPLGRRERALGAGVAPFRSSLGQRIGRILDKGTHAMSTVTPRLRLTIAALTVAAALGGAFLVSSAPAQVSAAPVIAPVQTGKPSLVGTWLGPNYSGTRVVMIFSADGKVEQVGPWPENNQQVFHGYGRYAAKGSKLTYTLTRGWLEGQPPYNTTPEKHVMDYTLLGNVLTVRLKGKWVNVNHRVPAYTKEMLGIKPVAAPDVQPSAVLNGQLDNARFLAGLTPVQGPGVVVTLNDSKKAPKIVMPSGMTPPNIIHDTDINQVVNELKAAGAEAIAVNDQRLVATSSVRVAGPTVLINFIPVVPPFAIEAIGNPKTLAGAMNIPGGIATQLKAYDSAMFSVREAATLTLPAYSGGSGPRYARPLAEETALRGASDFLAGQIAILQPLQRRAEEALVSYKAHHRTRPDQQTLADLTRAYNTKTTEYQALLMRLSTVQVQLDLAQIQKQRLDQPASSAPGVATLLQPSASSTARASLLQQRDQLAAQLHALNAQAASLNISIQAMQAQAQQAIRKLPNPSASTQKMIQARRQALLSQIVTAQAELAQKKATMAPQNPAILSAQMKIQSLVKAYQELPIREKQEFVKEVHQYVRKRGALINALSGEDKAMARQLSSVRRQQSQLQTKIALLNSEIARRSGSHSEH